MKNIRVLLSLSLVFANLSSTFAQKEFTMGVKLGMNLSTQKIEGGFPSGVSTKAGLHFGLLTEAYFTKATSLKSEFLVSNQGYKYKGRVHSKLKSKFIYINVPILFKWHVNEQLGLLAGPQFGMLFEQEFEDDRRGPGIDKDDLSTSYARFDAGAALGLDWQFYSGVGVYIRHVHGLKKINDDPSLPSTQNRAFQFGVSYRF